MTAMQLPPYHAAVHHDGIVDHISLADAAVAIANETNVIDGERIACHHIRCVTRSARCNRTVHTGEVDARLCQHANRKMVVCYRAVHQIRTDNVTVRLQCSTILSVDDIARTDRVLCRIRRRQPRKCAADRECHECGELPLRFHSFEHCFLPFIVQ